MAPAAECFSKQAFTETRYAVQTTPITATVTPWTGYSAFTKPVVATSFALKQVTTPQTVEEVTTKWVPASNIVTVAAIDSYRTESSTEFVCPKVRVES